MAVPQKFKHRITIPNDLEIPLLGIYPKELKAATQTHSCTPMFTAALSTMAKIWRQPKCSSIDEWIMECYSTLKRKEILTHATTWLNLEDIMLSEISQSQKDKYCMIPIL